MMQIMAQNKAFIVSCLCMLAAFVCIQKIALGPNVEVLEKNLDKFPYTIATFVGGNIIMEDSVIKELDTDVYVFRKYRSDKGEVITLYIGYYGTKKGGRTGHGPGGCYPGSGWAILNESQVMQLVAFDGKKKKIKLNSMKIKRGNIAELVFYWYQSNGDEVLSSGIEQNLHRFRNKILHNRNDGAFIRVSTPITQSLSYTESRLKDFIKKVFPLIVQYWPVEREL